MCSGATLMSRVKRVCYAVPDPKMGCLGGATNLSELARVNHRVEITAGGVLEDECRVLLQAFFKLKRAAGDVAADEPVNDSSPYPPEQPGSADPIAPDAPQNPPRS